MRTTDPEGFLNASNRGYLLDLMASGDSDKEALDPAFFDELIHDDSHPPVFQKRRAKALPPSPINEGALKQSLKALMLIRAFRVRGHLKANLDPLKLSSLKEHPELDYRHYGFSDHDLDKTITLDGTLGFEKATLGDILKKLHDTYCGPIGLEYMHIQVPEQKQWLQKRIENEGLLSKQTSIEEKHTILKELLKAEFFEKFLHVKFPGAKRFSLEGGESLMPALDRMVQHCASQGIEEVVLGMAHRGRLNVLANLLQKPYELFFSHFANDENAVLATGSGDVKYHLGYSCVREQGHKPVKLSLTPNPSHLEAVNPVVLGKTRAKQDMRQDKHHNTVMGVLIHGDAAFAGQGLVAETLCLSGLKGYKTGGTLHIIINNQIGFTTPPPHSRSSPYSSDIGKMIQTPVLHVNGDDPEAVVWCMDTAMEFRKQFQQDIILDLVCYRRFGHNEGDEPAFTQPTMYKTIKNHPTPLSVYLDKLKSDTHLKEDDYKKFDESFSTTLKEAYDKAMGFDKASAKEDWLKGVWQNITYKTSEDMLRDHPVTGIMVKDLLKMGKKLYALPENFNLNTKIERLFKGRLDFFNKEDKQTPFVDWGTAEALAFGSLVLEGHPVRLSGQDCGRGTFSHRHAALIDQETEERYVPLQTLSESQASFHVIDSPLSEASVLGFEYGYAQSSPHALVLWEAQFGDFSNGAQVIIDQFISSGESKWLRLNGLVMLLPHGYEGQGPEHSSCRLERYLQLCGEGNMYVANCTTPANYFHILRRQLKSSTRKPLVIATPKSLLRHKHAVSSLSDMGEGTVFQETILTKSKEKAKRLVLCSGKIYYELLEALETHNRSDIALLRLEQLYPYPKASIEAAFSSHPDAEIIWCQEEPANMGPWIYIRHKLEDSLESMNHKRSRIRYAGIGEKASPAPGYASQHAKNQAFIMNLALNHIF
jgi:2-oxoglutarate dehydrogenase E1 component